MKFKYLFITAIAVIMFFSSAQLIRAQDTLTVEWADGDGNLLVDALYNTVMGDTVDGGGRANLNRVYKLKRGGYYWNNSTIVNNGWTLRLVGEPAGNTIETAPPVIQMVLSETGAAPGKMFQISGSFTFKNIYFIGSDDLGVQTYYQPIEIGANDLRCIVDNCVFERSNFSMLAWQGGANNDIFITNCKFRNLIERPPTQQWAGRGISIWTDQDTVVVENNTFFNINMVPFQLENGAAKYVRFNHNTLVNIGRNIHSTSGGWWTEAYLTNLLLINVNWHGEGFCDYGEIFAPNRDPRAYYTGMFAVNNLPSRYGTDVGRRIAFSNSAAYLDDYFKTRYDDTVRVQPYINAITDSFFTSFSPANGGQMVIRDTAWLSDYPNFTVNPDDEAQLAMMYDHITKSRAYQYYGQSDVQASPYYYALPTDPVSGDTLWTSPTWPLPENFTYTDADLMTAGTDGLPLGDLNWFPADKNTFEANKDDFVTNIEAIPGNKKVDNVVLEEQAEAGTIADGAEIVPFTGNSWYTLTGGSSIEWTFNSSYSGHIDMEMKARADGDNIGFDFILNDHNIVDAARGWGQFVAWTGPDDPQTFWSGKSTDEFYEASYAYEDLLSLDGDPELIGVVSGDNTLKLQYSWNSISFAQVDIYEAGTTNLIASLIPADATNNGATPAGEGTWVPEGFNSVALGTNGSTSFNIDLDEAGDYLVRLFYQNVSSVQSGSVSVDGNDVATVTFDTKTDSTGLDFITELFSMSQGAHTLKISGSGANLDKLQIVQRTTIAVGTDDVSLPDGYSLAQNYPNPFNPSTKINFSIGNASNVKLTVYNILGQRVATLVNGFLNAGYHTVQFNARHLASGVYFYRIEAGDFMLVKKMMLLK